MYKVPHLIAVAFIASVLLGGLALPVSAGAADGDRVPPAKGCRFVATADIELQIFDDIANGDEGDFIDSVKLRSGERSDEVVPQNKRRVLWYKYRYRSGTRWYSKHRLICVAGAEIRVPG